MRPRSADVRREQKQSPLRGITRALPLALFLVLVTSGAPSARTWLIRADGSGDAPTIQAGIDSASAGDTVLLEVGTFAGPGNIEVNFRGKPVTVTSIAGSQATVINCGGVGRGFIFNSEEGSLSVLSGVTVQNGFAIFFGGAIFCRSASPKIVDNIFIGNQAGRQGGAIYSDSSSAIISGNAFDGNGSNVSGGAMWVSGLSTSTITYNTFGASVPNFASENGGAIACDDSQPIIAHNIFVNNGATFGGALDVLDGSAPTVENNEFTGNGTVPVVSVLNGGAIRCQEASPEISSNTFTGNEAQSSGGAIYCELGSSPLVTANTLYANVAVAGAGIFCTDFSDPVIDHTIIVVDGITLGNPVETANFSKPKIGCSDLYKVNSTAVLDSVDMGGNISEDPLFCGIPGSGNFYLRSDSPCVDCKGSPIGRFGVGCQTVPTQVKSWGALKAIYREKLQNKY